MDLLECYTFEEDIDKETGFTRSYPQGYLKLLYNLKFLSDLIPHSNPESKKGSSQTAQITEPLQGGKSSLNFVMLRSKVKSQKGIFFKIS